MSAPPAKPDPPVKEPYAEPPEQLSRLTLRNALAFIGPGVIIASVTIGSGELVWASRSGAIFGYQMLWCFLLAGSFKAIQVYTAARYMTLTGHHPMTRWADIPGPPLWLPLLIALPTLAVMPIAFSGISEILGGYLRELTGIFSAPNAVGPFAGREFWENIWATATLTFCWLLAISSSLSTLERVSAAVLGLIIACAVVAVVVCGPSLLQLVNGLLLPRVPPYDPWVVESYGESFANRSPWLEVALYLTAVGGGTFDYIGYIGMLREKGWGRAGQSPLSREQLEACLVKPDEAADVARRARLWIRAPLLDTGVSFSLVILVTLLFAVLGALVLHTQQKIPDNDMLLSQQERFLTLLHPRLFWVYRAGVLLAFVGTLYGAFEIYQHTVVESLRAVVPTWSSERADPWWRMATVAYCFMGGLLVIWLPQQIAGNVVGRMTFGAVISGALLCGVWCFAMLWTEHTGLPPALRMRRGLWWLTLLAGIVMSALGVQTLIAYFV